MENKEIHGYIYLLTNKINGKQYVGHTTTTIKKRFDKHCCPAKANKKCVISRAIKKYGRENFIVQELAVAYNQEELTFLEGMYICWFNTLVYNEYGYNVAEIINGKGKHSEETKEKMKSLAKEPERLKISSEQGKKRRGKSSINSSSKYCGVTSYKTVFICDIHYNKKTIHLGNYPTEMDAAKAYDIAAIKYFGNNAVLNFPELLEDYINGKIIVSKNSKQTYSISGERGIYFSKKNNKWEFKWFDKISNKNRSKYLDTLEEAKIYKNKILENKNNEEFSRIRKIL